MKIENNKINLHGMRAYRCIYEIAIIFQQPGKLFRNGIKAIIIARFRIDARGITHVIFSPQH